MVRKQYGQSRTDVCPFCGSTATSANEFGVPTCRHHVKVDMPALKCFCGDWLDVASGKWGPYFRCMRCGNISWSKGLEANPGAFAKAAQGALVQGSSEKKPNILYKPSTGKDTTIRSDDPEWF